MSQAEREQELRIIARERIANGELPCTQVARMWGGFGNGRICSLCRELIQRDQMELEVETDGHCLRFHVVCQSVWQLECASQESPS
jgi:hypothetical protein